MITPPDNIDKERGSVRRAVAVSVAIHVVAILALIVPTFLFEEPISLTSSTSSFVVNLAQPSTSEPPTPPSAPAPTPEPRRETPRPTPPPVPEIARATPEPTPPPDRKTPAPTPVPTKPPEVEIKKTTTPAPTRSPAPTPKRTTAAPTPAPTTPAPTPARTTAAPTPARTTAAPRPTPRQEALSPEESARLREQYGIRPRGQAPSTSRPSSTSSSRPTSNQSVQPADASASSSAASSDNSMSMKLNGLPDYYCRQLLDNISRFFNVPPEKRRGVSTQLQMRINRDGTLTDIRVIRSSGDRSLDQYALSALEAVRRVAPLPDDFGPNSQLVEISFRFDDAA